MPPTHTRKVVLEGRGPLTLRSSNYVATGGEGSIYRASRTVIKIYLDSLKMKKDSMSEKVKLLSALKHPFIVSPKGRVLSAKGSAIGLYMPYVNGEPLARVFTNDFRAREQFGDTDAKVLVQRMYETVSYAHSQNAILADPNELNWLVLLRKNGGPEPRVIDVDSWQMGLWKARMVMPSIRDWHEKGFTELSDWFAWGVVTFQVFTGIHPYKGTLDGFMNGNPAERLESRMKANASVFSPQVRLNKNVRDFSTIPGPLLDWYVATFQDGERIAPPQPNSSGAPTAKVARTLRVVVAATGALRFKKLLDIPGDEALRVWPNGAVHFKSGKVVDLTTKRNLGSIASSSGEIVHVNGGWLKADLKSGIYEFSYICSASLVETKLSIPLSTLGLLRYEDRLFVITDRGLTELVLNVLGKPFLSTGKTWGVMVNATRWFDGVGVQDVLGSKFLVLPFETENVTQVRAKELDGIHVVAAKGGHRFVNVIGIDSQGVYRSYEFSLNSNYRSHSLNIREVDGPELNLAILPRGVCATAENDGELFIFVPRSGAQKMVKDKIITTDLVLGSWGDIVIYIDNGAVWSVSMK